jgi:hypothetical protein
VLSYLALPGLLIWFYRGRNVRLTFQARDPRTYWTDEVPVPLLVLCALYLFFVVVLHVLILFHGIFPVFGAFFYGMRGVLLLDLSSLWVVCLIWGTIRQRRWAWWGALIFMGLFTVSTLWTLAVTGYAELLAGLAFPPRELEFLSGLPVQGYHLALLAGIPLLLTCGLIILSRRFFDRRGL